MNQPSRNPHQFSLGSLMGLMAVLCLPFAAGFYAGWEFAYAIGFAAASTWVAIRSRSIWVACFCAAASGLLLYAVVVKILSTPV